MIGIQTCASHMVVYLFCLLYNKDVITSVRYGIFLVSLGGFMNRLRAAAYCRVSSNKHIQLQSLEAQKEYYENYFKSNPQYKYIGIYADVASGIKSTARKAFNRMISDCRKGKIDIIFTKSISRFSRDTYDFLITIRKLKKMGVDVYFQNEDILLSKQGNEFMMTVFEAIAQQESVNKSEHIKWGLQAGFKSGNSNLACRVCYGYQKGADGKLMICPEQTATVRLIFDLYINGNSLSGIAKELHRRAIPSPTGKEKWTSCAIDKILSNEKYTGDVMLQKTFRESIFTDKQTKNQGEKARYVYENNHIAIIEKSVFESVQAEKQRRSNMTCSKNGNPNRATNRFSSGNSLSGKIRCSECGRNFRRIKTRSGEILWKCAGQVEHTADCHSRTVKQSEIDSYLSQIIQCNSDLADVYRHIECITVNAESFGIALKKQ